MCKYCETKELSKSKDWGNGCEIIHVIKNGNQNFELALNRYGYDNHKSNTLEMNYSVRLEDGSCYGVKSKSIKIKYCPFCGEKF